MLCNENVIYSNVLSSLFFTTKNVKFAIISQVWKFKEKRKRIWKKLCLHEKFWSLRTQTRL